MRQQEAEKTFCLGDLVGYGPYPNEVVAMIRDRQIPTCQGCWDEDIVDGLNACECSYPSLLAEKRGRLAHEWTNREIHSEVREYLATLPITLEKDNLCFVHGSPNSQHEYLLPSMDGFAALERVLATDADVLFCGHTHVPYERTLENASLLVKAGAVESSATSQQFQVPLKQIINAGSVGEPRHGRPNATYVIYNTDTAKVTLREVAYHPRRHPTDSRPKQNASAHRGCRLSRAHARAGNLHLV